MSGVDGNHPMMGGPVIIRSMAIAVPSLVREERPPFTITWNL